jgi:hypothetical protein
MIDLHFLDRLSQAFAGEAFDESDRTTAQTPEMPATGHDPGNHSHADDLRRPASDSQADRETNRRSSGAEWNDDRLWLGYLTRRNLTRQLESSVHMTEYAKR